MTNPTQIRKYINILLEATQSSNLKQNYEKLLATLELTPGSDEGFFGRNFRNNRNNEKLAQFARDNNLPGMFNPETGRFVKFGEDPEGAGPTDTVDDAALASMDDLEQLAAIGALPANVVDELNQEVEYYDTGERSLSRRDILGNIFGDPNPEYRDRLLGILKKNQGGAKKDVQPKSKSQPNKELDIGADKDMPKGGTAPVSPVQGPEELPDLPPNPLDAPEAPSSAGSKPDDIPASPMDAPDAASSARSKPDPNVNPLANKPGDYTGADGIEDMGTGMFVKPEPSNKELDIDADKAIKPKKASLSSEPDPSSKYFGKSGHMGQKSKAEIKALQTQLKNAGYNPGDADGIIGKNTTAAIKKLQRDSGIAVDGLFGKDSLNALAQKLRNDSTIKEQMETFLNEGPEEKKAVVDAIRKLGTTDEVRQWMGQQGHNLDNMSDDEVVSNIIRPYYKAAMMGGIQAKRMGIDPKKIDSLVSQAKNMLPLAGLAQLVGYKPSVGLRGKVTTPGLDKVRPAVIDVDPSASDVQTAVDVYDKLRGNFPKAADMFDQGEYKNAIYQIYKRMADK